SRLGPSQLRQPQAVRARVKPLLRRGLAGAVVPHTTRWLAKIVRAWASIVAVVSRAYIVVFWMLACPSQSFTNARSAPASSKWVAIECFKQWNFRFSLGSPASSPYVCMRWCSISRLIGTLRLDRNKYGDSSSRVRTYDRTAFKTSGCMGYTPEIDPF